MCNASLEKAINIVFKIGINIMLLNEKSSVNLAKNC